MTCITLLSDFGLHDTSVAVAKGVLMQHTSLPIVDISHEVKPYQIAQAAYLLGTSYKNFPQGTIHVLLFDLFAGATPRLLLCEHEGQYFLTPDNGLLPAAINSVTSGWLCMEMAGNNTFTDWLNTAGSIVSKLQNQKAESLGLPVYDMKPNVTLPKPRITNDRIVCDVIHIDHYENAVLNVTRELLETQRKGRNFRLSFMMVEEITELSNHYHDVREGFKLCRFNSNGYLEICINRGKAASLFGLRLGSRPNDIKIFFE